jgi:uncharacterized Zn finger protein (UPF0148 family)
MNEASASKIPYYYACCPKCKAVLIQAQNGLDGYTKCPKCGEYVHIVIRDGLVTTRLKTQGASL